LLLFELACYRVDGYRCQLHGNTAACEGWVSHRREGTGWDNLPLPALPLALLTIYSRISLNYNITYSFNKN